MSADLPEGWTEEESCNDPPNCIFRCGNPAASYYPVSLCLDHKRLVGVMMTVVNAAQLANHPNIVAIEAAWRLGANTTTLRAMLAKRDAASYEK